MLQSIRDRVSGIIAYTIVILISIPFALWGIQQYFGGGGDQVVATVNGEDIPAQAFNRELQRQRNALLQAFGGRLPPGFDEKVLRRRALDAMVRQYLLNQEVDRLGYSVSDAQLIEAIQAIPQFQVDGRFDPQRYDLVLKQQHRSKVEFEQIIRQQLRLEQYEGGLADTAFLAPAQVRDYQRLRDQKRELRYFVIAPDLEAVKAALTDEEIQGYYQSHLDDFQRPAQVRIQYVRVGMSDLERRVEPDEAALRAFYEEQADRYVTPEERRVRHIVVRFGGDSGRTEAQARQRIGEAAARLAEGEAFDTVAQALSDDELTRDRGGDLGWIARGDLSRDFDAVAFRLEPGERSEPVKVGNGFEIVEVMEVRPAVQKPFEEVRDQVATEYRRREAERAFLDVTEQMMTLGYEQSDTLQPVADAVGAEIQESDWFSRDRGEGVAAEAAVREAAFGAEVYEEGRNSDLIELPDGSALMLRVADKRPPQALPLEEVREQVVERLALDKAREQAAQQGVEAVKKLRDGADPAEVAASLGASLEAPGPVTRTEARVPPPVRARAFALQRPGDDGPVIDGLALDGARYAVVILDAVLDPQVDRTDPKLFEQLARGYGGRELEAALRALEAEAEIEVRAEGLESP
jgi:peptidyl-prolyl cis-trans isomerase D